MRDLLYKMATLFAVLGLALYVIGLGVVAAQPASVPRVQVIFSDFDATSTSFVFCDTGGITGIECASGTADDDGAITVGGASPKAIQVEVDTINATSLDFIIEGRLLSAENQWAQIWPASGDLAVTVAGSFIVQVPDWVNQVRLGVKIDTDSGAQNIDAVFNLFRE